MAPTMLVCNSHSKKCVKCGESIFSGKSAAEICDKCFKKFRDHCPICGSHLHPGVMGFLCRKCAREYEGYCVMCDERL